MISINKTSINNAFRLRIIKIFIALLLVTIALQTCHYIFYYDQNLGISLIWSLVDWSIWFFMFSVFFYYKSNNRYINEKSGRGFILLSIICLLFPILHAVFSNAFFLMIFEPSRSFFEDVLRHFSKKWFQNIFVTIGFYFLFDYLLLNRRVSKGNDTKIAEEYKLTVRDGGLKYQLLPTEIEWIESAKNYVVISTFNGEQIVARKTISSIYNALKDFEFIRISRSTIVNKNSIRAIKKRTKYSYSLVTKSNQSFSIGKTYLKSTLLFFNS